jgi:hypothetical protein
MCRLVMMQDHRYPKQCYRMLKGMDDGGRVRVKNHKRVSHEVGDVNAFIFQLRQRLTDGMCQDWHARVDTSSHCDLYIHFKSLLDPEKYLCIDIPFTL